MYPPCFRIYIDVIPLYKMYTDSLGWLNVMSLYTYLVRYIYIYMLCVCNILQNKKGVDWKYTYSNMLTQYTHYIKFIHISNFVHYTKLFLKKFLFYKNYRSCKGINVMSKYYMHFIVYQRYFIMCVIIATRIYSKNIETHRNENHILYGLGLVWRLSMGIIFYINCEILYINLLSLYRILLRMFNTVKKIYYIFNLLM